MTDHFKNIEAIFNQVIELPQDQQYEKIKLLANDDQEVISDVIELIKADKEQRINMRAPSSGAILLYPRFLSLRLPSMLVLLALSCSSAWDFVRHYSAGPCATLKVN